MASEFVCPKCEATLRTAKPLAPGKRVKCPHCSEVVTVPEKETAVRAAGKAAPAPAAAPAKEKSKRPRDEDDEDAPPRRKRGRDDEDDDAEEEEEEERPKAKKKKKAKSGGGKGLMIGLIIGGAVLLLGGVGLTLFLLLGSSNPLVGAWEGSQGPMQLRTEFTSGGRMTTRFTMTQQPPAIPGMPAMTIPPFSINGSYKIKGNMVEINISEEEVKRAVEEMKQGLPPAIRGFVNPAQMGAMPRTSVEPFRRDGDNLTLGGVQLRRVK
jgi:flagellar basal body-associated protein FliL/DNA-directed RNA polymerase subunit RPC12/RpoP